jgi:hypothetical protein
MRRAVLGRLALLLSLGAAPLGAPLGAQEAPPASAAAQSGRRGGPPAASETLPDSIMQSSLRVFLDCQGMIRGCDRTFFVQEMGFVNWVRDRFDSDVHLLLSSLNAANGGRQITVNFLGQKGFAGKIDTLVITTLPNDADDRVRRELLRTFQLGLAQYVARTPIASRMRLALANGVVAPTVSPRAVKDKWNLWLYRIDGNLSANGEQLVKSTNLSGTISAARTSEKWKINLGGTTSYNERDFKVFVPSTARPGTRDTVSVIVLQRAANTNALFGRSITEHLTVGMKVSAGFSEILNQKFSARVSPAVEYNIFPWTEATRRQLTALYYVGPNYYEYYSRTVFNQERETRVNHTLLLALTQRQKWGNTNLTLEGSQYLHDTQRNHVTLSGFVDLRLGRGFSLNFRGSASRVRDQIYIAANVQSERDILTQRQQLQTNFRYNTNVGIGYTFGSIYNTIVNQRFGNLGELGRRFGFQGG